MINGKKMVTGTLQGKDFIPFDGKIVHIKFINNDTFEGVLKVDVCHDENSLFNGSVESIEIVKKDGKGAAISSNHVMWIKEV